jgi:hypothetical protein
MPWLRFYKGKKIVLSTMNLSLATKTQSWASYFQNVSTADSVRWFGQNKPWKLSVAVLPCVYKRRKFSVINRSNSKNYPLIFLAINRGWKLSGATEFRWNDHGKIASWHGSRDNEQRIRSNGQETKYHWQSDRCQQGHWQRQGHGYWQGHRQGQEQEHQQRHGQLTKK